MSTADPYSWGVNWPPSPIERQLRNELATAVAKVEAVELLILKFHAHPSHGGLVPSRQILNKWIAIDEEHQ